MSLISTVTSMRAWVSSPVVASSPRMLVLISAMLSLSAMSSLKAVEYGVLGWMLARLVQKSEIRASRYFGTGALIGIVFGGAIAWIAYQAGLVKGLQPGPVQIAASLINEVLFPVGCSAVIYAGQLVGRSARLIEKAKAATA